MTGSEKHIDVVMQLVDRITKPLTNVRDSMAELQRINQRTGTQLKNVGRAFEDFGSTLEPVSVGIVGAAVLGSRAFVDFDATITGAGAKAGATAEEMNQLRSTASQLGAEFPISATEAAQGMDRLAAAGYNTQQIMGAMPSIITAAVASGEDLATTSDVVSNALNIWNLKSGDVAANAAHVADVVQMAANQSSLGMQDFGVAMQYAGAPAATLGVSIEQLSTAMAIMKNNGIDASTIGTSLRSTLSRLASPPRDAADALQALGIQTKDASGNFIGLQNVVDQMRTSMSGLSDTQQVAYAKAIAGEDAYSGLLSLIRTAPGDYQAMADAISNSTGSSAAQFDVMKNTMKFALDDMKGSFESLAINVGTAVAPQITSLLKVLAGFADLLNSLPNGTKVLLADLAAGVVGVTAFSFAMSGLFSVAGGVYRTLADVGVGITKGSNAMRGTSVITAKVVDTLSLVRTHAIDAGEALLRAGRAARSTDWSDIGARMTSLVPQGGITGAMGRLRESMVSTGTAAANMMRNFSLMRMMNGIGSALNAAGTGIRSLGASLRTAAIAARAFIFSPLGIALLVIAAAVYVLYSRWNQFAPYFLSMWQRIQQAVGAAIAIIRPALQRIGASFAPLITAVRNFFTATMQGQTALSPLLGILGFLAQLIGGVVVSALITLAGLLSNTIVTAVNVAANVISMFLGVLNGIIEFVTGVFTGNWAMAWQGVVDIFSSIFGGIQGICDSILEGVRGAINAVIDGINSISVDIPDWVPGLGGKHFQPAISHLYTGTEYWRGGPAVINDKYGGEMVDLPRGARVIPHDQSINQAYGMGKMAGGVRIGDININFTAARVDQNTAKELTAQIVYELSTRLANQNEGAI